MSVSDLRLRFAGLPTGPQQGRGDGGDQNSSGPENGARPGVEPGEALQEARELGGAAVDWIAADQGQALAAAGAALGLWLALLFVRSAAKRIIGRFGRDDPHALPSIIARAVGKISAFFLLVLSMAAALSLGAAPDAMAGPARIVFIVVAALQLASLVQEIAISLLMRRARHAAEAGSSLASAVAVLKWLISGLIWAIALLVVFDTLGVQVTALIAGLGVGGIAIGLAAQGIFADLFASLSILFDKPFKKGDFIIAGTISGTVEQIGLRTTRIRALSGEMVVMSNTRLTGETVHNYQVMSERRFADAIGVTYQTPAETVEAIPGWLRECVESAQNTRFDRAHFTGFGDSALLFELVYFVETRDYYAFMDARQAIALAILRRFEAEGVAFAYPTRTLFLAAPEGRALDPSAGPPAAGAAS